MSAVIRPATLADIPAMVRLEEISFPGDRLSARSLRRLVREGRAMCLVAETDGRVTGDAIALPRRGSRSLRLYSVAVDPALRKAGIGTALLAEAERWAASSGHDEIRLEVREDNAAAIRFYRSGRFDRRAAIAFTLGGIPAVLIAVYVVKSLPLDIMRWIIVAVLLYTSATLWKSSRN